jgi:hypothetical protein
MRVIRKSPADLSTFGLEPIPGSPGSFLVTNTPGVIAPVQEVRNFTGVVQIDILFTQVKAQRHALVEEPLLALKEAVCQ